MARPAAVVRMLPETLDAGHPRSALPARCGEVPGTDVARDARGNRHERVLHGRASSAREADVVDDAVNALRRFEHVHEAGDRLTDEFRIVEADEPLPEDRLPAPRDLGVVLVAPLFDEDVIDLPLLGSLVVELLHRLGAACSDAEDPLDFRRRDLGPEGLVTHREEVALLAALLVAVERRMVRREPVRKTVRLHDLAATAAFEDDSAELLVEPVVRFELADLEWIRIAVRIADRADEDLRMLDAGLVDHDVHELRELLLQNLRNVAHGSRDVEEDGNGERFRMLGTVPALPDILARERARGSGHSLRVEARVDAASPAGAHVGVMAEVRKTFRTARRRRRRVDAGIPSSATHDSSPFI